MASNVTNLVKSNIVSQVPYFISFKYVDQSTKPTIKLVDTLRYYNNQTTDVALYGATNINATFNGEHADWNYKSIQLTADPTSQTNPMKVVFASGDEALFEEGSYFQHKTSGEIMLVEKVNTTTHVVDMRRALFGTTVTTLADDDYLYQLNTIQVASTAVEEVQGIYTVTIAGTVEEGDKITVNDTVVTLDATSGASTTGAATAVKNAFSGSTIYTVTSSSGVVTFTEKSGKYGTGAPTASIVSDAGTVAVETSTAGRAAGFTSGIGMIWANPMMGPSATGYFKA